MRYNTKYNNLRYSLMSAFMLNASKDLLDVSYTASDSEIMIQIVLLRGTTDFGTIRKDIAEMLPEYSIEIREVWLTKEQFNENKGEWIPIYYSWLDSVLFCKAEVI